MLFMAHMKLCTKSLYSVLGLGYPHMVTKVNRKAEVAMWLASSSEPEASVRRAVGCLLVTHAALVQADWRADREDCARLGQAHVLCAGWMLFVTALHRTDM